MWRFFRDLISAYRKYDPATKSRLEIFFLYPGVKAVFFHKVSHRLYRYGVPFIPRALSEFSRFLTGIEIHPGAKIGKNLIIDHGMGVVIGETASIGDHCLIYHGVTLGGVDLNPIKRHPTLMNHVVVGAGAKILGNITIGESSRIGANSVVIKSIPAHSTALGIPAKVVSEQGGVKPGDELKHDQIESSPVNGSAKE
jgi:serine O-acetyltransferase